LPDCLRVDNGQPWGSSQDLPSLFALWVVGLGVRWHWNDPHCPQQNPKIERAQGTGQRWAEPGTCRSVAELQARLDEADRLQREAYVTPAGASRLELFPDLRHSGRRYTAAAEARGWRLAQVEEHLAEYVAVRRVGAGGSIFIYRRLRYVGRQYAGQDVQVQYDPQAHGWLVSDAHGRELRRHEAPEISAAALVKLQGGKTAPDS
jgi:hypothetical protein